jgi:Zinc carboxypeptidase
MKVSVQTQIQQPLRSRTPEDCTKPQISTPKQAGELPKDLALISEAKVGRATLQTTSLSADSVKTALQATLSSNLPGSIAAPIASAFQSGFVEGYLTAADIRGRCEALQKEYPHLVELVETGISTHGYDGSYAPAQGPANLFYLRLGPKSDDRTRKTGIFQYAAPHARERVNPMTMMELTEQLVRNYDPSSQDPKVQANTRVLDELDVFVAINTNPDGHNFATYDDPDWRKNRAPVGEGEVGVDINRNYPYEWTESTAFASEEFSGQGPGSEAETQAILQVTKRHPNIMFVVDWHSYGQEIRRPLGTSKGDDEVYDEMHGRVQSAIKGVAGNEYSTVVSQVTQGTSDDHFYVKEHVYSTVMETGQEFIPVESEALVVMEESVAGAREFLEVARDYQKSLSF